MTDFSSLPATKALYDNLKRLAGRKILFGHQDALAYGVTWKDWHAYRTDVNDVCGKFPAVYGWDLGRLGDQPANLDSVDFKMMQAWMKEVYRRGGVNTVSWHFDNLVRGTDSWDTRGRVVSAILPGAKAHQTFIRKLDAFADFVEGLYLSDEAGSVVPLLFRPFHEHSGGWFWWGNSHCTAEEYKALWRFTVHYLRDEKQLHNLIYVYSPDVFKSKAHYLERYPGDAYVDVLGLDDYHDLGPKGKVADLLFRLRSVVQLAEERGKVAALTETGLEAIPQNDWWTKRLLQPLRSDPVASRIAWILLWRNDRPAHHYGPYPGHASAADFRRFAEDPLLAFEADLPDMYRPALVT